MHDVGVTSTESDPDGWPRRPGILSTASTLSARSVQAQPSSWMPVRDVWSTPRVSTVSSSSGLSRSSIETFRSATSTLAELSHCVRRLHCVRVACCGVASNAKALLLSSMAAISTRCMLDGDKCARRRRSLTASNYREVEGRRASCRQNTSAALTNRRAAEISQPPPVRIKRLRVAA